MGCVHFILAGEPGRDFLGQWPRPGPHSFSDLSLLFGACPFCSCLSARRREQRLSGKDGKPKGYLGPDSSLVQEGTPSDPKWAD